MRYPQILVYERDGRLADLLRRRIDSFLWQWRKRPGWLLREPRQPDECEELLRPGHPSVFVLRLGSDLPRELALLDRVSRLWPDVRTVAVGDSEDAVLAGLAWDLGARFVLFPPQPRELLPDVVAGLMESAIQDHRAAAGGSAG